MRYSVLRAAALVAVLVVLLAREWMLFAGIGVSWGEAGILQRLIIPGLLVGLALLWAEPWGWIWLGVTTTAATVHGSSAAAT